MTQRIRIRPSRRPARIAAALALLAASVVASPAAAARPDITRAINTHFHHEQHFGVDPACGPYGVAVTEISDGNEHLVVVGDGERLNVTYGEEFLITVVPDDPSLEPWTRRGTDALAFVAQPDGDVVFHESFHDYGPAAWDPDAEIRFVTTFTTKDGEVVVDHAILHDMPPPGC